MLLTITSSNPNYGRAFTVTVDGTATYETKVPAFSEKILIHKIGDAEPMATIERKVHYFQTRFYIEIQDTIYEWFTEPSEADLFRCWVGEDLYEIIPHAGHKHTITRNFTQIGWWDKEATWLSGRGTYTMVLDADADHLLAMAFCLIVNRKYEDHSSPLDMGNMGWGLPPFNENWKPK